MKTTKWILCSWITVLSVAGMAVNSFAGSPEFAYSEETWAALKDNNLKYAEISDLIHEYNSTVIQNQIEYKEYKNKSRDDISEDYYDAADDVEANLEYPDSSDENYASSLYSYLNGKSNADSLREEGDDNVEDGDIKKLGYDQTEAGLVKEAQEYMISYWSQTYSLESLQKELEQYQTAYDSAVRKLNAGVSAQSDVLSAKEAVTTAEASLLSAESSLKKTRQNLCQMLGWSYETEISIEEVPEPDVNEISSIDLQTDIQAGLTSNYNLKILEKKIANAQSTTSKESLQENYSSQKVTVANSIKSSYQSLILSKSDYEFAYQTYETEKTNMDAAKRKLQAGTITKNEYMEQQLAYTQADVNVRTQKLTLLQAQLEYQWAVKGIA